MSGWLFVINPAAPRDWDYGWDVARPETLLASTDKVWPTASYFRKLAPGDELAVYTKNAGDTDDGIYIVGTITAIDIDAREFTWRPDRTKSRALLRTPIPRDVVYELFGRGFGGALRRIKPGQEREWTRLVARLVAGSDRGRTGRP